MARSREPSSAVPWMKRKCRRSGEHSKRGTMYLRWERCEHVHSAEEPRGGQEKGKLLPGQPHLPEGWRWDLKESAISWTWEADGREGANLHFRTCREHRAGGQTAADDAGGVCNA